MVIGAGMDWNSPYSCKDWVKKFMLTFPVIDDTKGRSIYNHFGDGIVPFNIVINRYGQLVYSKSGFFQVTNVEHSIDGMNWTTSIEGQYRSGAVTISSGDGEESDE